LMSVDHVINLGEVQDSKTATCVAQLIQIVVTQEIVHQEIYRLA